MGEEGEVGGWEMTTNVKDFLKKNLSHNGGRWDERVGGWDIWWVWGRLEWIQLRWP